MVKAATANHLGNDNKQIDGNGSRDEQRIG
jgi:hypothetical protein